MFEYAAKNLRTWAGVIRPHFEGERTPLYADDPDNAPEQLESAARFLEAAEKVDRVSALATLGVLLYVAGRTHEEAIVQECADIRALIEAIPEEE